MRRKPKLNKYFFEQYKIIVGSAEKVSFKRQDANKFYLAVNSALISLVGYLSTISSNYILIFISLANIIVCFSWLKIITSYRQLNAAKFKLIHEMEEILPIDLFKKENQYLVESNYYPLTFAEEHIPWAFILLNVIIMLISFAKLL